MALGRVLSLRLRATVIACALLTALASALPAAAQSRQDTRTLKLHFTHTGERGAFTYRRGGQYDRRELERINHILRDWRRNEPTRMDPALLDLLWEIQRRTGSSEYIHVISAYRAPATNEALRRRGSGVAQNSQHTRGRAIDFFIPGVPVAQLRAIALAVQGGGVGYYPASGSPFVHVDTGSVRHWPRMTRQQLASLFPDGETLHLPSDGKPMPGYERALAKQKAGQSIAVAAAATTARADGEEANVTGWLQRVFSRGGEDRPAAGGRPAPAAQPTAVARAAEPARREPPRASPTPRPVEAVEPEAAADEAEIVLARADGDGPPMPRAMPAKTRMLLVAARERAQLARMAAAAAEPAAEPAATPAAAPQARPAAPVAVAALGDRRAGDLPDAAAADAPDPASADAALAGLYAAAGGGNPEPGGARPMNAAAVEPQPAGRAADHVAAPKPGELAAVLLGLTAVPDLSPPAGEAATALDAANALGWLPGDAELAAAGEQRVELAYALESLARRAAAAPPPGPEPQAERAAVADAAPMPLVAVRLDRALLRRLMAQETTRTGSFGRLALPEPRPDFYEVPADGRTALALVRFGQPRTDRFQPR